MRLIKKLIVGLIVLIALVVLLLLVTGHKYILTATSRTYLQGHNTANINDHEMFDTRIIKAGAPQPWALHPQYKPDALPIDLTLQLKADDAVAFLVVHQGQLTAEQYFLGYGPDSQTNSFSMAKTMVTMLLGIAIEERFIQGLDQPITDFLPEFKDDPNGANATIGSLSTMSSGYEWDEAYYSPFSPTVKLLYADDVGKFVLGGAVSKAPESYFYYSSASTQILGLLLTRALKVKNPDATLTDYFSEKLWKPLGMNADGLWHVDNEGLELAYCCVNTNARNYAKLGQLILQGGQWKGEQLITKSFIDLMRTPKANPNYGYSTWLYPNAPIPYYAFQGHLGQFIIVVPGHDLVIVRLGESFGARPVEDQSLLEFYVAQAVKILPQQ